MGAAAAKSAEKGPAFAARFRVFPSAANEVCSVNFVYIHHKPLPDLPSHALFALYM